MTIPALDSGIDVQITGDSDTSFTIAAGGQTYPNCQISVVVTNPFTYDIRCPGASVQFETNDDGDQYPVVGGELDGQELLDGSLIGDVLTNADGVVVTLDLEGVVFPQ